MTQITENARCGASFVGGPMFVPLIAIVLMFVLVPAAQAAPPAGAPVATVTVGAKGKGLRAASVKVTTSGRAKLFDSWVGMPISDVSVGTGSRASFVLSGTIKLRKGKHTVRLRGLLVKLDGREVRITGKIGSKRLTIFTARAASAPKTNASLVLADVTATNLRLTKGGARAVHKKIRSFPARSRKLGLFKAAAWVTQPTSDYAGSMTPADAAACKPVSGPSDDPAKPVTAVDVSCASLVWHVRNSWVNHATQSLEVAPARGLLPIPAAGHACPDDAATRDATYSFWLPALSGWWDAASQTGNLRSAGGERSIVDYGSVVADIEVRDLEIKLAGASSEIWASVHSRSNDRPESDQRVRFATFDAGNLLSGGPVGPGTALSRMRIAFTPEGAAAFDLYPAGSGFGCIDVGFDF